MTETPRPEPSDPPPPDTRPEPASPLPVEPRADPSNALPVEPRADPSNPLPVATRTMWWAESAAMAVVVVVVAMAVGASAAWLPMPVAALLAAGVIGWAIVVPLVRWRRWRWELHEEEVDLLYGAWRVVRTIVPITRIQHVSVERTGWTDAFGLVRLHVHTAAGRTTIPGLRRATADDLRDRILARLRLPDDL